MPSSDPQICVVTGAAGGIGLATTNVLRNNDWTVVGLDRQADAGMSKGCQGHREGGQRRRQSYPVGHEKRRVPECLGVPGHGQPLVRVFRYRLRGEPER